MKRVLSLSVFCSLTVAIVFAFQNCENHSFRAGTAESSSASVKEQGGGVYDGKIYRSLLSGVCSDGNTSRVEVLVKNQSATLIHDGCAALQQPVDLPSLSLMAHNNSQAIFRSRVLTEDASPVSNLLCRGSETHVYSDRTEVDVIDIVFTPDASRPADNYTGQVKLGIYDQSGINLIDSHNSEDILVVRNDTKPAGLMAYTSSAISRSSLLVVLNVQNPDGSFSGTASYNFDALKRVVAPVNPGPSAPPPTGPLSSESSVRGLHVTCYPQAE